MFYKILNNGTTKVVDLKDMYLGESLFLIGGSPLIHEENIKRLQEPGIFTMAMNNAATIVHPNFWVGGDRPECYSPDILTDVSILKFAVGGKQTFDCYGIPWHERPSTLFMRCGNEGFTHDNLFSHHDKIVWWNNTWWIALSLAWTLGFRTIYMVGSAFTISTDKQYAWDTKLEDKYVNINKGFYEQTAKLMIQHRASYRKAGMSLRNCCKPSILTPNYGYLSVNDAINLEKTKIMRRDTINRPHSKS